MTLDNTGRWQHRPGDFVRIREDGTQVLVVCCQGCDWEYTCGIIDDTKPTWELWWLLLIMVGRDRYHAHYAAEAAKGTLATGSTAG